MKKNVYDIQSINGSSVLPSMEMNEESIPHLNFKTDLLSQQTLSGYELAKNMALTGTMNFLSNIKSNFGEDFLLRSLASYNFGNTQVKNFASQIILEKLLGENQNNPVVPAINNTNHFRNNSF